MRIMNQKARHLAVCLLDVVPSSMEKKGESFRSHLIFRGCAVKTCPYTLILCRFSEADAIGYLAQVISAIRFLHSNGFTHSDVKLSNAVQDRYTKPNMLTRYGGLSSLIFFFYPFLGIKIGAPAMFTTTHFAVTPS